MPEMKRVTVDIDGTEVSAIEAHYVVSRAVNPNGLRVGDSMRAKATFYADIGDTARNEPGKIKNLWKIATETVDPLHKCKITYYKNDTDVLNEIKFQGWISVFETFNPAVANEASSGGGMGGQNGPSMQSLSQFRNVLYVEIPVVLDDANFGKHEFADK